ncbi:MAG: F0F1 ATP synthase subunit delta [Candidatus Saccharimonadales bacterium]
MASTKRIELATVIADMLASNQPSQQLSRQIAGYLVAEHQTKDLDIILRDVMTARAKSGTVEANVTTAFPLSSSVKTEVQKLLKHEYPEAKHFVLQSTVQPDVLSGVRIQTPDKQLDETARGKLENLRRMHV